MGLTDYLSRDASGEPEPVSNYDEKFVVASVRNFFAACDKIKGLNTDYIKSKPKSNLAQNNCIEWVDLADHKLTANEINNLIDLNSDVCNICNLKRQDKHLIPKR